MGKSYFPHVITVGLGRALAGLAAGGCPLTGRKENNMKYSKQNIREFYALCDRYRKVLERGAALPENKLEFIGLSIQIHAHRAKVPKSLHSLPNRILKAQP